MKAKEVLKAIEVLESDRGINKDVVIEALVEALEKAYRKNFDPEDQPFVEVRATIDPVSGDIRLFDLKTVVEDEELDNDINEIPLSEALKIRKTFKVGDIYEIEVKTDDFGRLAAVQAKQILRQKIREAEKQIIFDEFADRKDDIITGVIDRVDPKYVIINLGKTGAVLPQQQQIPGEFYREGANIKVYVVDVDKTSKGAQVIVSRSEANLVKRLFELEVPEIFEGIVEIKSLAREAGDRSKMAVYAKDSDIDAIGACIGPKGTRVQSVVEELGGEKIDIIEYSLDPVVYISNALAPAHVTTVLINEDKHSATVIVPDNQLSLAIGRKGQNARLAVRLTGWKIDIKSESDAVAEGIEFANQSIQEETVIEELKEAFVIETPVIEEAPIIEEETMTMAELLADKEKEEVVETVIEPDVMPIYTEEELAEIDENEVDDHSHYDEDIDYDEYDKYYDN